MTKSNQVNQRVLKAVKMDDHGHISVGLNAKQVKAFKIVFIFVNFSITYMGLLPKVIPSCRDNETVLSVSNCFSAGIFLAMALMHLIPGSEEAHRNWALNN